MVRPLTDASKSCQKAGEGFGPSLAFFLAVGEGNRKGLQAKLHQPPLFISPCMPNTKSRFRLQINLREWDSKGYDNSSSRLAVRADFASKALIRGCGGRVRLLY